MVSTRSSTGKLPPPKLKSLIEEELEFVDENSLDERVSREEDFDLELELDEDDLSELTGINYQKALQSAVKLQNKAGHSTRFQRAILGNKRRLNPHMTEDRILYRQSRLAKRDAGRLARLMDAPLDIFVEVASYLEPLDLLHLSRVTIQLRKLLMSRHSRNIWKAARIAIGMPKCPNDLDEPLYASLVFEKHCNVCGAPRVLKPDYVLRLRLCSACTEANIIYGSSIVERIYPKLKKNSNIFILTPNQNGFTTYKWHTNLSDQKFFMPDLIDALVKYLSFGEDEKARKEFVDNQKKRTNQMIREGRIIDDWVSSQERDKQDIYLEIAKKRRINIITKLQENGWNDSDIDLLQESGELDSYANQPRDLTPRIWKTIFPQLQEILVGLTEERSRQEREIAQLMEQRRQLAEERLRREKEIAQQWEQERQQRRELMRQEQQVRMEKTREMKAEKKRKKNEERNALRKEKKRKEAEEKAVEKAEKKAEEMAMRTVALKGARADFIRPYQEHLVQQFNDDDERIFLPNFEDILEALPLQMSLEISNKKLCGAELWSAVTPLLPKIFATHKDKIKGRCRQLIVSTRHCVNLPPYEWKQLLSTGDNDSVVEYAWSYFKCIFGNCSHISTYPDIIGHEHISGNIPQESSTSSSSCIHGWRANFMKCHIPSMQSACMLLLGLNLPLTTPMKDVRAMGQTFRCLGCDTASERTFTWEGLVRHFAVEVENMKTIRLSAEKKISKHFTDTSLSMSRAHVARIE